ncbi:MAG: XdhC family protein [Desulfobacterota bacterium]|nr:XdhC family protein [Thermodesulfobacteriota bacterium]
MKEIYREIVYRLESGDPLGLATLIRRIGSAPREPGAKYLVRKDGTALGSIGGGCVEAEVWQETMRAIERQERKVLHFNLTSEQLAAGGLICGGNIEVFVEPLLAEYLPLYKKVLEVMEERAEGVLATVVSAEGATSNLKESKAFYSRKGGSVGALPEHPLLEGRLKNEMERILKLRRPEVVTVPPSQGEFGPWGKLQILLEPVFSAFTVYIFGAGHISEQLAPLAKKVHFRVVVIDDREMFANRERFPDADEIIVTDFDKAFEKVPVDSSSFIVIVTRGHLYDGLVLKEAVKTDACYIGMIGSRKKIATLYKKLSEEGIPESMFNKVHAPIGLDIGSETPEEIAISIVAQLIQERRKRLAS